MCHTYYTPLYSNSMRRKPWVRNCSRERKGMYNGNVQQNPLCAASCFHLSPVLAYVFLSRGKSSTLQCTVFFYTLALADAPIILFTRYSSINRLYAKIPVFEIVHEESVKVYHLHMYNGNIQQNYLCICVESCVTEEFHISPRFSPAFFHRDAMCCTSFVNIVH